MSRLRLRSRRGRWLLALFAGALLTLGIVLVRERQVTVAVYNDSDETWSRATLAVGRDLRHLRPLPPRHDLAEVFAPQEKAAHVELAVEGSRIIHWNAPYLVQGSTARIILHVDRWGGVTATVEPRLLSRLLVTMK